MNYTVLGIFLGMYGCSIFAADGDVPKDLSGKEKALREKFRVRRVRERGQSDAPEAQKSEAKLSSTAAVVSSRKATGFNVSSGRLAGNKIGRADTCDSDELRLLELQQEVGHEPSAKCATGEGGVRLDGVHGLPHAVSDLDLAAQAVSSEACVRSRPLELLPLNDSDIE